MPRVVVPPTFHVIVTLDLNGKVLTGWAVDSLFEAVQGAVGMVKDRVVSRISNADSGLDQDALDLLGDWLTVDDDLAKLRSLVVDVRQVSAGG